MTEEQKIQKELLLSMFQEYEVRCRHHENLRATITSSLIAIDSIIVGIITYDNKLIKSDLPLIFLVFFLGIFGIIFTLSHSERYLQYSERSRQFRAILDERYTNGLIEMCKKNAKTIAESKFKLNKIFSHHFLWSFIHLVIVILGIVLFIMAS
jgi:hypothetical protein